MTPWWLC